jgi:hypothetical protein
VTVAGRTGLLRRVTETAGRGPGPLVWIWLLRAVLWLLVVAGPVAVSVLWVQVSGLRHRVETVSRQAVVALPTDSAGVEGFAELFVAAFLSADDGAAPALSGFVDARWLQVVEQGGWSAVRTVSLGARELAPGYFAVTVAAEVLARDTDSGAAAGVPVGLRFFTVGVVDTASGWVAVGPPALVAAPPTSTRPDLLVRRFDGLREVGGLEEAVTRFLAAYLTGEGELDRYVTPGSALTVVQPPPFVAVEILDAGSVATGDGARQVIAVVQGTDEAGRSQVLQYALAAAPRDGRWEVAELLPAPSLATTNNN